MEVIFWFVVVFLVVVCVVVGIVSWVEDNCFD